MPNMTKQALADYGNKRFCEGVDNGHALGISKGRAQIEQEYKQQFANAKLEQLKAVTVLLQEQGKLMSKTGYLLAQLSDKKGW